MEEDCLDKFENIQDKINNIRFATLEQYYLGYTLSVPIAEICLRMKKCKSGLSSIIKNLFFDKYGFNFTFNKGGILFFVSHTYLDRKGYLNLMKVLANLYPDGDLCLPYYRYKVNIINLKWIKSVWKWNEALKAINVNANERLYLVANILNCAKYLEKFDKAVSVGSYRALVVRLDGQVLDNIIVQYAKNKGITTVTVQDGYELGRCNNYATAHTQSNLLGSVSDWCLTWSEYFNKIISQTVIKNQKLVSLGMPKYIEAEEVCFESITDTRVIGVMLDHHITGELNIPMIKAAKKVSEMLGYKYMIKYHPVEKNALYDELIDERCILCAKKDFDFIEFLKHSDIVIGCNSSTLLESAYVNKYTYRMLPQEGTDYLSECEFPCCFEDEEELISLIQNQVEVPEEYINYTCGPRRIRKNYAEFFRKLMVG